MAKQLSDDERNLRRKTRRRLIGALAFTLSVIVILPMVLDSEPNLARPDIDLRIPAVDDVAELAPGKVISDPAAIETPSVPLVEPVVAPDATPVKLPVEVIKQKAAPKKKNVPTEISKTKSVAESFVAQVGAYSNVETAKQELAKLKKWGFKAYTEKAAGMTRVRVGPYPDRAKAEKARQQLEKHGLHPVVMHAKGS